MDRPPQTWHFHLTAKPTTRGAEGGGAQKAQHKSKSNHERKHFIVFGREHAIGNKVLKVGGTELLTCGSTKKLHVGEHEVPWKRRRTLVATVRLYSSCLARTTAGTFVFFC